MGNIRMLYFLWCFDYNIIVLNFIRSLETHQTLDYVVRLCHKEKKKKRSPCFTEEKSFLHDSFLIFSSLRRSDDHPILMSEPNTQAGKIFCEKLTLWTFNILWNPLSKTTKKTTKSLVASRKDAFYIEQVFIISLKCTNK